MFQAVDINLFFCYGSRLHLGHIQVKFEYLGYWVKVIHCKMLMLLFESHFKVM